uniref:Uncharacterized protein n=1 Tax=Arcella intermedia TaxID=1963864 RepID=A0A6B2LQG7_9EUKA
MVTSFLNAVDFDEDWLLGLIGMQIGIFLLVLLTWNHLKLQTGLFFLILGVVASAESLNSWAFKNYTLFSKQNYFTPEGIFLGVFLCSPLLLDALLILINLVKTASSLLVKVKSMELKKQQQEKAKAKKE